MKERGVVTEEVEAIIANPEAWIPSVKGRHNAFGFLNGRFLRVTVKEYPQEWLVITVVVRQKPFGEKRHEN